MRGVKPHVVILGAGFGGLELATRLGETLSDRVRVTLLERSESFTIGFRKFDVMFGRATPDEVKSFYRDLASPHVEFRRETIVAIDPVARRVTTDGGTYDAEFLVVALGADVDPAATQGLVQGGHDFYTLAGAQRLRDALPSFRAGTAVVAILGNPYKCPPAPFECALQLHDDLVARGVRDATRVRVLSPNPTPLPVSQEGSETVLRLFAERDIEFCPGHLVQSLDPEARTALVKDRGPIPYDLLLAVPVHRAPHVVARAGLLVDGWVPVDPATLETRHPGVFAVGDVNRIPVGQAAIPKAGAFAGRAAEAVAAEIARRVTGTGEGGRFDGAGTCFLEFGGGAVAKVEANFLGGPSPVVRFVGPSHEFRADKEAFASTRLGRWFRPRAV
jgi:sulfide:quinone oxidoreductase